MNDKVCLRCEFSVDLYPEDDTEPLGCILSRTVSTFQGLDKTLSKVDPFDTCENFEYNEENSRYDLWVLGLQALCIFRRWMARLVHAPKHSSPRHIHLLPVWGGKRDQV